MKKIYKKTIIIEQKHYNKRYKKRCENMYLYRNERDFLIKLLKKEMEKIYLDQQFIKDSDFMKKEFNKIEPILYKLEKQNKKHL